MEKNTNKMKIKYIVIALDDKLYDEASAYVNEISPKREIDIGYIIYYVNEKLGGGVIRTQPDKRRIELSDKVNATIFNNLKKLNNKK